jgi:hypothetical protein
MATTFATTFKNKTIDSLTGKGSTTNALTYFGFYNGSQPAAPSDAPAGSPVYSSYSVGINVATYMSQPAGGISAMSQSRSASATSAVSSLTFARIYDAAGTAQIDTPASLTGGGGGAIVPSLSSSAGVAFQMDQFSLKLPNSLGTVYLNNTLRDALVAAWCNTAANVGAGASATINVYSGSVPSDANVPATGTLLVSFTTAASGASWNAASGGSAALVSSLSAVAGAGSATTATYARMVKGTYVLQGTVGTSGTDFVMDSVTITSGNTYSITNATITI